ncbi:MAG: hypothetical protein V4801_05620, partial [Burkholderia gladioli]
MRDVIDPPSDCRIEPAGRMARLHGVAWMTGAVRNISAPPDGGNDAPRIMTNGKLVNARPDAGAGAAGEPPRRRGRC